MDIPEVMPQIIYNIGEIYFGHSRAGQKLSISRPELPRCANTSENNFLIQVLYRFIGLYYILLAIILDGIIYFVLRTR